MHMTKRLLGHLSTGMNITTYVGKKQKPIERSQVFISHCLMVLRAYTEKLNLRRQEDINDEVNFLKLSTLDLQI